MLGACNQRDWPAGAGDRTIADSLVLVLHIGYAFVPLGFLLVGLSAWASTVPPTAGVHAWTAGSIGIMTLAVMARATLGHTGQPLQAGRWTTGIYAAALDAETKRKALENGAEALFTKPIDFVMLRSEIDTRVERAA